MIDRTKLPNSFEFVVTAGARARQLLAGSRRASRRRAQEDDRRAAGSHDEGRSRRSKAGATPRPSEPC